MGKTRLALQAAADLLDDFPDGVWFVDLSVLDDPALVPSAIAPCLACGGEGQRPGERLPASRRQAAAARPGQLRAGRRGGPDGLRSARPRARIEGAGDQPHAPARLRRAGVPACPAAAPDPAHLPAVRAMSQYEAVRLFIAAGAGGQARLRRHRTPTPPPSPRSALGWMVCRWRLNWPRRSSRSSRPRRCSSAWSSACRC